MSNVIELKKCSNLPNSLRALADTIEENEGTGGCCTIIHDGDVYQLGTFDDAKAAENAIFDMTFGIHKLMKAATDE